MVERMRFSAEAAGRLGNDRGGAPGGAARPKQAVRASGSFCGARRARSASRRRRSPAWRGPQTLAPPDAPLVPFVF